MALITCPHCGERVSDTVERCIHCGKPIKEKPTESRSFESFSTKEKEILNKEFEASFPEYSYRPILNRLGKMRTCCIAIVCLIFFGFALGIFFMTNSNKSDDYSASHGIHFSGKIDLPANYDYNKYVILYTDSETILLTNEEYEEYKESLKEKNKQLLIFPVMTGIGMGVSLLVVVLFTIVYGKTQKKYFLHYKIFIKWLRAEKGIECNPTLSPHQKTVFNNIDIEKYKI